MEEQLILDQLAAPSNTTLSVVGSSDRYTYTEDLKQLEANCPQIPPPLPPLAETIASPLVIDNTRLALREHPDRGFVQYILNGLAFGFRIGFGYEEHGCRPSKQNMLSAVQNPGPVEEYLQTELAAGRIVGPFEEGEIPTAQIRDLE